MNPQPIGAGAYGIDPNHSSVDRQFDLAKFPTDITRVLTSDEARALHESIEHTAGTAATKPRTSAGSTLGSYIDIRA